MKNKTLLITRTAFYRSKLLQAHSVFHYNKNQINKESFYKYRDAYLYHLKQSDYVRFYFKINTQTKYLRKV
jgi:hypothetical protein